MPALALPSSAAALPDPRGALAAALRAGDPPVIGRRRGRTPAARRPHAHRRRRRRRRGGGAGRPRMTLHTLGTAGHVDHGKTALDPGADGHRHRPAGGGAPARHLDRARLRAARPRRRATSCRSSTCPGHERFVRTMVAGATGIDLALRLHRVRRRRHAADARAPRDPRPARGRARRRGAHEARPGRRRRRRAGAGGRRRGARRDPARRRRDRRGLGAHRRSGSTRCATRCGARRAPTASPRGVGTHAPAGRPRVLAARHRHRRDRHAVGRLDRGRRPRDACCRSVSTDASARSRRTTATSPRRSTAAASPPAWSASSAPTSRAARRSSPGRRRRRPTAWTSSCTRSPARAALRDGDHVEVLHGTASAHARVVLLDGADARAAAAGAAARDAARRPRRAADAGAPGDRRRRRDRRSAPGAARGRRGGRRRACARCSTAPTPTSLARDRRRPAGASDRRWPTAACSIPSRPRGRRPRWSPPATWSRSATGG